MTSISSASAAFTGRDSGNRLYGPLPDVTEQAGYEEEHPTRVGFFTDTSVCIGCKACEVACKEWNTLPMDDSHGVKDALGLSGMSYDNTGQLGANSWRHVAFIEQSRAVDLPMPTFGRPGDDRHDAAAPRRRRRRPRQPGERAGERAQRRGAERVRPADRPERRGQAGPLADDAPTSASTARTPAAWTSARPGRCSAPSSAPSSCRATSATAAATASPPARTASSTSARTTAGSSSARCATTG